MPKCKNDPARSYKGTEPSPKGLGFCAHAMKEGATKKGKDGNKWIIKKVKNGSKRWMKVSGKGKLQKVDKKVKKKEVNKKVNKVVKRKQGKRVEKKGKWFTFDKEGKYNIDPRNVETTFKSKNPEILKLWGLQL